MNLTYGHLPVERIGWILVHFVWQGAAIAALLAAWLWVARPRSASIRYAVAVSALGAMAMCPIVTFLLLPGGPADPQSAVDAGSAAVQAAGVTPGAFGAAGEMLSPMLPGLVGLWLAGVILLSIRFAGGWLAVQRLRSRDATPAGAWLSLRFADVCERMGVRRRVLLLESTRVDVPVAIGFMRACILLPASAVLGLEVDHLQYLLAHELAHVRRHDYLVNLLQSVIETLLFYQPAVWWVSETIRVERENCCDDMAVAALGDRTAYARALTALEELRATSPSLALASTGGDLLSRVRRVISSARDANQAPPAWFPLAAAAALIALAVGVPTTVRGDDKAVVPTAAATQPTTAPPQPASTTQRQPTLNPLTLAAISSRGDASDVLGLLRAVHALQHAAALRAFAARNGAAPPLPDLLPTAPLHAGRANTVSPALPSSPLDASHVPQINLSATDGDQSAGTDSTAALARAAAADDQTPGESDAQVPRPPSAQASGVQPRPPGSTDIPIDLSAIERIVDAALRTADRATREAIEQSERSVANSQKGQGDAALTPEQQRAVKEAMAKVRIVLRDQMPQVKLQVQRAMRQANAQMSIANEQMRVALKNLHSQMRDMTPETRAAIRSALREVHANLRLELPQIHAEVEKALREAMRGLDRAMNANAMDDKNDHGSQPKPSSPQSDEK